MTEEIQQQDDIITNITSHENSTSCISSSSSYDDLSNHFMLPWAELFFICYYVMVMGSLFLMIGIAYYMQILLKQWWKLRHFRSPFALPLIGNCYNPEAFTLFRYLANLRKELGTNFVIYLFTNPFLVTIDPNVVQRVLCDSKSFDNPSLSPHLAFKVFGDGLLFPQENHQLKKSVILSYYSLARVSKSVPALNDALSVAFSQLFEKKLLTTESGPISVNLEDFFIRVALRSFLNYACGVDLRGDICRENEVNLFSLSLFLILTLDMRKFTRH